MNLSFHEEMVRLLRSGRSVVVATVIRSQGSTPRRFGTKMIIPETGETAFTIGGGAFEALVIEDAREALRQGSGLEKEYRFTERGEDAVGMVCGGTARVLFELVVPPTPLIVFGAGHVGRELATLGSRLGFDVTVVDDRPRYLTAELYPRGVRRVRVEHDFSGELPPIARGAHVAIVTRCHRTDLVALRHTVGGEAAYVGVIGSRRKVMTLLARAQELGSPPEALRAVRGPIGLPIGAQTPGEIAVSVVAEIIALRNASARQTGRTAAEDRVTPIERGRARASVRARGSAPRPLRPPSLKPGS